MTDDTGEQLSESPEDILSRLSPEAAAEITIIGGQALSVWGDQYLLEELTGEEYIHLASDDLDLLGKRHAIELCAQAWGGQAEFPAPDDHSPNSGVVMIRSATGDSLAIDFLDAVYGLKNQEVLKYADVLPIGDLLIPILSPPLCLKSRINNLVGLGYSPEKEVREVVRIRLAASATRMYILDYLNQGNTKGALKIANYLIRKVFLTKEARTAYRRFGAEFLHALPARYGKWPPDTAKLEFPKRLIQVRQYLGIAKDDETRVPGC
ncbi:MAG: hypothetical protein CMI01_01250 [Oceanospirillaceae bacterium]|nr:hypothetical protein [Oceanospirillaceae bacterium]